MSSLSSQHHSFDIKLAAIHGVDEALIIHHFQHWIRINRFKKTNLRDGRYWTYQTRNEIQATFPYWTTEQIRHTCDKLVDKGILLKGNYNRSAIDKTIWYAFVDEDAFGVGADSNNVYERENSQSSGKNPNPVGKIPKPIPDTKTDTKTNKKKERGETPPHPPSDSSFTYSDIDESDGQATISKITMPQSKHSKLIKSYGEKKVAEMLKRLHVYSLTHPKKFKEYGCYYSVIKNWISLEKEKKDAKDTEKVSKHHGFQKDETPVDSKRVYDFR